MGVYSNCLNGSERSKLQPLLQPLSSSWSQNELEKNVSVITWHSKAGWVSSIKHSLYISATNQKLFARDFTAQATGASCSNVKQCHLLQGKWNCCLYPKCLRSCLCCLMHFFTPEFSRFIIRWVDLTFNIKKDLVKIKTYLSCEWCRRVKEI